MSSQQPRATRKFHLPIKDLPWLVEQAIAMKMGTIDSWDGAKEEALMSFTDDAKADTFMTVVTDSVHGRSIRLIT